MYVVIDPVGRRMVLPRATPELAIAPIAKAWAGGQQVAIDKVPAAWQELLARGYRVAAVRLGDDPTPEAAGFDCSAEVMPMAVQAQLDLGDQPKGWDPEGIADQELNSAIVSADSPEAQICVMRGR